MSCLFEPIYGRFPTNSICDSYPDCVGCSYSDSFKQPKQTNADRIRAMTDEELAKFLNDTIWDEPICNYIKHINPDTGLCDGENCYQCVLDWLREERKQ